METYNYDAAAVPEGDAVEKRILPIWNAEHRQKSVIVYMIW